MFGTRGNAKKGDGRKRNKTEKRLAEKLLLFLESLPRICAFTSYAKSQHFDD